VIVAKRAAIDVRQWAIIGAEQRLLQIAEEAAAIHRAFPELRRRGGRIGIGRIPASPSAGGGEDTGQPRRRRRRLSAAARKRISDAQKKRWAKQRKAKAE
jgi:hypothetical protein